MTETAASLRVFVESMEYIEENRPLYKEGEVPHYATGEETWHLKERRLGQWHVHLEPGYDDFNKEVAEPGVLPDFPDGATAVRSDDDFWLEAVLPYRFHELTIQEIVAVLWPEIENPKFHEDVSAYMPPPGRHLNR